MAALDVYGLLQNVRTMLSESATWQGLAGTGSQSSALSCIHEYGVPDECKYQAPIIILDLDDLPLNWTGGNLAGLVQVLVRIELEIPEAQRGTYANQAKWFWQQLSGILADIDGLVRGSGDLMFQRLSMPLKPGRIDPDDNNGRCDWMTMLAFEIYLQ
jgi:hypothetical protein